MTETNKYNFTKIEKKWREHWENTQAFKVEIDRTKPKHYSLCMFKYPSGNIHMGHVRNDVLGDIDSRYMRKKGYNVLNPTGWDAFGLPAENAAIERNINPKDWTLSNIDTMRSQMKMLGISYDWSREFATCDPSYYRHEQEMFIEFFNSGLAYQKESYVNWDPVDCTVLANEQVENGRGWRSGALVERKKLNQWFLKITDFADDLLENLKNLTGWKDKVLTMQHNWIGKSIGCNMYFNIENRNDQIKVFTTRPDTIFGASFIALAPDHPLVAELNFANKEEICNEFLNENLKQDFEKKGVNTGLFAQHPFLNDVKIPIFIANFVVSDYGTGALFGCPAHDERDYEFATKYNLPILQVVSMPEEESLPYTGAGSIINSEFLNGLSVEKAKELAISKLQEIGLGEGTTQYKLRDWGISRQRYWGCPIPMINCEHCGTVPVPKEQLPVTLPEDVDFSKPGNPLANHPTWKHVKCPKCGSDAERETDTFDTFVDSAWYFARFCDNNTNSAVNKEACDYWLPVDTYIGGIEHAVMHLLYARFFSKALTKTNFLNLPEPFTNYYAQGMVLHETYKNSNNQWVDASLVYGKSGKYYNKNTNEELTVGSVEKMSKSKRNTVSPMYVIENYGSDTARMFVLSDSPPDKDFEWTTAGLEGTFKFLNKLYSLCSDFISGNLDGQFQTTDKNDKYFFSLHALINDINNEYKNFGFNKVIAKSRELFNLLKPNELSKNSFQQGIEALIQLLNPITPHITEEIWQMLGYSSELLNQPMPKAKEKFLKANTVTLPIQINGKMRGTIEIPAGSNEDEALQVIHNIDSIKIRLADKTIKKVIFVKDKIINIIVA